MSLEKNKAVQRKVVEEFNKRNLLEENKAIIRRLVEAADKTETLEAVLDDVMVENYFDPFLQVRGREGFRRYWTKVFKAVPDYHETIEDIIAEGDKVWARIKATGTHTGEFEFLGGSFAPTGKKLTTTAINIWRIADGKIAEKESAVLDLLDFYKGTSYS